MAGIVEVPYSDTGIILRKGTKSELLDRKIREGELIFATDTNEFGFYDSTVSLHNIRWGKYDNTLFGLEDPVGQGVNGQKYLQLPKPDENISTELGPLGIDTSTAIDPSSVGYVLNVNTAAGLPITEDFPISSDYNSLMVFKLPDVDEYYLYVGTNSLDPLPGTITLNGYDIVVDNTTPTFSNGILFYQISLTVDVQGNISGNSSPNDSQYIIDFVEQVISDGGFKFNANVTIVYPYKEYVWYDNTWNHINDNPFKIVSTIPTIESTVGDNNGTIYLVKE